jgi:hypothetical protein
MATVDEINTELREMLASYPQHAAKLDKSQLSAMRDVWQKRLADLPPELLAMACANHIERSQWLPSIAEIRASAVSLMRQSSPADQDWNEAYAEMQRQILRVGYVGVPEWTNPALAETVKTLGGWRSVCMNEDPEGVARAQFRDVYQIVIGRMERKVTQSPEVRGFIESMRIPADHQLEAGDAQDLIKRLAEAKRV